MAAQLRSFMLSFLAARYSLQGAEFSKKQPGAWLVWEPGRWHAPGAASGSPTVAGSKQPMTPAPGDALCFLLSVPAGTESVQVGRDPSNGLTVNDATVSRRHALLINLGGDSWGVQPVRDRVVRVDGRAIASGFTFRLTPGAGVVLGSVRLTWYDPPAFAERLTEALLKAS